MTGLFWAGLALGAAAAAGLLWLWRYRQRSAPAKRRSDRAPGFNFVSTQHDTVADTVLDPRVLDAQQRRIGPYVVERDIGHGAMGAVLLCRDERTGEAVALKTMALGREFHGDALTDARERFFREAEMAGRLHHPDIVAVREAGEQDGTAYIAMELLSGHDLSEFTQTGRLLPVPAVLGIIARVAQALAHAHRQGVTHRDIKPANIMVELKSGMVKVTDFGIARIIDSTQTRTGIVLGTPSFMSPEQMAGARVDGRSDLYALGVTLFQLLTGALPHRPESMAELIRSIANDVAPDVRTLRPELPAALADIVALALEKRPEIRYADGEAMATDLHAVLVQLREQAREPAPLPVDAVSGGGGPAPGAPEAGHNP
jgi:serine/threonine-protein kinase